MTRTFAGQASTRGDRLSRVIAAAGVPRIAADVVARPRLTALLDRFLPLTVLGAPTGYGKTTLVAQWHASLASRSVSWVSVERAGTNAETFWRLVAASLGTAVPEGTRAEAALRAAVEGPGLPHVLVIDDLDLVAAPDVVEDLLSLLRRFPRLHVVATTSSEALDHRLWLDLDGQVLGAGDLAFTADETAAVLTLLGAPSDDAEQLEAQLGGWPIAVRAYALARRNAQPDSAIRTTREQLTATVLRELGGGGPISDRDLETALIGGADAGRLIQDGPDQQRWVHWPGVVSDAIIEISQREDPGRVRRIRRDLVTRLQTRGEYGEALRHAASAEDWAPIRQMLESHPTQFYWHHTEILRAVLVNAPRGALGDGIQVEALYESFFPDAHQARSLLAKIPEGAEDVARFVIEAGPPPNAYNDVTAVMWPFRLRGDLDMALRVVERVPAIRAATRAAHPDDPLAHGSGLFMQCGLTWLHAGDLTRALADLEMSQRYAETALARHMPRDSAAKLALVHAFLGDHPRARTWIGHAEAAPVVDSAAMPFVEAALAGARLLNAVSVLDRVAALAAVAELDAVEHPREELWVLLQHARARAAVLWGHPAATSRELEQVAKTGIPPATSAFNAAVLLATRVDLALSRGLGSRGAALLDESPSAHPIVQVRRSRLALLTGDTAGAVSLARSASEHASATPATDLDALVLEAVALARLGAPEAPDRLSQALAVAGRRIDSFALVPRPDLVALAERTPGAAALLEDVRLRSVGQVFPATLSVVPLTQRELIVLRHLAAGLTLPAVAHRETVSINTVKSQVRSIYKKLGATDRDHALENAAREGLVGPT